MGFWLFIASEVMLFGALFSSYALLRVSATDWPKGTDVHGFALGAINTALLTVLTGIAWRVGRSTPSSARRGLVVVSVLAVLFLAFKGVEYSRTWNSGLVPATSTYFALYYTLTGLHALHVIGGIAANVWVMAGASSVPEALTAARLRLVSHYWVFVDVVWIVIFVGMYLA
jgi:heme/copper-type cytochrome/quinol oxidase subunit 3